jgi:hypothetical protein
MQKFKDQIANKLPVHTLRTVILANIAALLMGVLIAQTIL